jgi:DNA-directed RNA polymerase subunit RPC12/RpoP
MGVRGSRIGASIVSIVKALPAGMGWCALGLSAIAYYQALSDPLFRKVLPPPSLMLENIVNHAVALAAYNFVTLIAIVCGIILSRRRERRTEGIILLVAALLLSVLSSWQYSPSILTMIIIAVVGLPATIIAARRADTLSPVLEEPKEAGTDSENQSVAGPVATDKRNDRFAFLCPSCNAQLAALKQKAGAQTRCPRCKESIRVPDCQDPSTSQTELPDAGGPVGIWGWLIFPALWFSVGLVSELPGLIVLTSMLVTSAGDATFTLATLLAWTQWVAAAGTAVFFWKKSHLAPLVVLYFVACSTITNILWLFVGEKDPAHGMINFVLLVAFRATVASYFVRSRRVANTFVNPWPKGWLDGWTVRKLWPEQEHTGSHNSPLVACTRCGREVVPSAIKKVGAERLCPPCTKEANKAVPPSPPIPPFKSAPSEVPHQDAVPTPAVALQEMAQLPETTDGEHILAPATTKQNGRTEPMSKENPPNRSSKRVGLWLGAGIALAVVCGFGWFVWPTRYIMTFRERPTRWRGEIKIIKEPVRINRFTGETRVLQSSPDGQETFWERVDAPAR